MTESIQDIRDEVREALDEIRKEIERGTTLEGVRRDTLGVELNRRLQMLRHKAADDGELLREVDKVREDMLQRVLYLRFGKMSKSPTDPPEFPRRTPEERARDHVPTKSLTKAQLVEHFAGIIAHLYRQIDATVRAETRLAEQVYKEHKRADERVAGVTEEYRRRMEEVRQQADTDRKRYRESERVGRTREAKQLDEIERLRAQVDGLTVALMLYKRERDMAEGDDD